MLRPVLAVASGLLLWQAFPDHDRWWCAPIAIALLALATRGARAWAGFGLGVLAGFAAYLPALGWSGIYVGALPWFALAVLQSLYVGLTGWASAILQRGRRDGHHHDRHHRATAAVHPIGVALAWTVGEWLRSTTPFGGFPWIKIAFSQADSPMLPLVRFVSTPGLTFCVALLGGLLAVAVVRLQQRQPLPSATALVAGTALLLGPQLITVPTDGPGAEVLAVQGNVPKAGLDFNAQRRAVLDNHVRVTEQAAAEVKAGTRAQPDLVVWPENASDIDPVENLDAGQLITQASEDVRAPILVGSLRWTPDRKIRNTTLYWDGAKGPTQSYAKRHPVPFAEYIPYRSFFRHFSDKVDLLTNDFEAGDTIGVMTAPLKNGGTAHVGLGICFEVAYDDLMRDAVTHGADILAVQTNNATFGYTAESYQQLRISQVRAVELGRSVVHISTVGTSALITPDGQLHQQTGLFTPAALSASLPLRTEQTVATRLGEWPVWTASAILLVLLATAWVRGRRPRRSAVSLTGSTPAPVSAGTP